MVLANARLSRAVGARLRALRRAARPAFASLALVAARRPRPTRRGCALRRARRRASTGNLKFDIDARRRRRSRAGRRLARRARPRPVLLAAEHARGRGGAAARRAGARRRRAAARCSSIVPRHPQRFDEVAALIAHAGLALARRSAWASRRPARADADVWLGDIDGRDGALLRARRRRAARRQLRAARRPEPDRGGGLRLSGRDRAAHLQLRARPPSSRWPPARRGASPTSRPASPPRSRSRAGRRRRRCPERAVAFAAEHRGAAARTAERIVACLAASAVQPNRASGRTA